MVLLGSILPQQAAGVGARVRGMRRLAGSTAGRIKASGQLRMNSTSANKQNDRSKYKYWLPIQTRWGDNDMYSVRTLSDGLGGVQASLRAC
jgi:hypothetical protein